MHLFAIGDLHLSFYDLKKRMDIFEGWEDYENKIKLEWQSKVKNEDFVLIAGDISWSFYLKETLKDFEFIESLPGHKIIIKGNHDYWWDSTKKVKDFWTENNLKSMQLLHNNAFLFGDLAICGSRGWILGEKDDLNKKILKREALRLENSILEGLKLETEKLIIFIHYPPIFMSQRAEPILAVLDKYKKHIEKCFYAHLHGRTIKFAFNGVDNGINFKLISADALNFSPLQII